MCEIEEVGSILSLCLKMSFSFLRRGRIVGELRRRGEGTHAVAHICDSRMRRAGTGGNSCELKAYLVYIASFRPVRAT